MKRIVGVCGIVLLVCTLFFTPAMAGSRKAATSGETLFKEHCAACHPDGGNIVSPDKTLHRKALAANRIKSAKDIVGKMRNPGPGMSQFDEKTIPDKDAKAIAQYILKTFR